MTAAVAAPAADLATLLADDIDDVSGVTIGSYAFTAYQAAYQDDHPGLALDSILTAEAAEAAPRMEQLCLLGQNSELHDIAKPLVGAYLAADPSATEPWASLLAENTPGSAPLGVPLFVAQGEKDGLVRPAATQAFAEQLCSQGEQVAFRGYPTATHGTIVIHAMTDVRTWLKAARSGGAPGQPLCAG